MLATITRQEYEVEFQVKVPIPVLEDYDISPITGFVPHDQPQSRLIQAHSYIWGSGLHIAQYIPEPLAVPWVAISDILDISPVLTYANNNLWNWKLKDSQGPYEIE
ncbi:hypothetical protein BGX29_007665 [Mortierella sp. GBA35]|nr:hypothetical protein BGX29_007665 [Mortierella sp. GBA35]